LESQLSFFVKSNQELQIFKRIQEINNNIVLRENSFKIQL
jgi:hypothetical protein